MLEKPKVGTLLLRERPILLCAYKVECLTFKYTGACHKSCTSVLEDTLLHNLEVCRIKSSTVQVLSREKETLERRMKMDKSIKSFTLCR